MMDRVMIKFFKVFTFSCLSFLSCFVVKAEVLDRIVAVVEDSVVLERELAVEVNNIKEKLASNHVTVPPEMVLKKQVLERVIIDKLQRQLAEKSGIRISDEMLRTSVRDIARRNDLSVEQFRKELEAEGMSFKAFEDSIRNEIIISQLRAREIGTRVKVTDREVEHYLETQGEIGDDNIQYRVGHILISLPDAASSSAIQQARKKAIKVIEKIKEGADFKQSAMSYSDGGDALKGGDLGLRRIGEIPTLFVDTVIKMNKGDVAELIRSPSGFHVIKLLDLKGLDNHIVTKTKARHILIKTNELINDSEAKNRLFALKNRIKEGDKFTSLARSNSDDKGSALKGGDLGWVGEGDLVPAFEAAMKQLAINGVSDPVQTEFGWHIIQVLERKDRDNSIEHKKDKVRDEIRKRKIEEETELWLRRLRDEAFVNINLDRL